MGRARSFYRGFATIITLVALLILTVGVLFPAVKGWTPLVVLTGSMRPTIQPGDVVVMAPVDGKTVQIGDVVAYHPADSTSTLITHRVVEVRKAGVAGGEDKIVVQGDDNDVADEPLTPGQVVGRMVYKAPGIGWFVSTPGKFALLGVLVGLLGVDTLLDRATRRGTPKTTVSVKSQSPRIAASNGDAWGAPAVNQAPTPPPTPVATTPGGGWETPTNNNTNTVATAQPVLVGASNRWTTTPDTDTSAWD